MNQSKLHVAVISSLLLLSTGCKLTETKVVRETVVQEQPAAQDGDLMGTSSGGGSFGDESSNYILEAAKNELIEGLRNTGRPLIVDFPEGWSAERMQEAIRNIKVSKDKIVRRNGTELMFNYELDSEKGGPYIEALSLFYSTYASSNINHMSKAEFMQTVAEIRLKLMHEVAHLMGIGNSPEEDEQARMFAVEVIKNIASNHLACGLDFESTFDPHTNWFRKHKKAILPSSCGYSTDPNFDMKQWTLNPDKTDEPQIGFVLQMHSGKAFEAPIYSLLGREGDLAFSGPFSYYENLVGSVYWAKPLYTIPNFERRRGYHQRLRNLYSGRYLYVGRDGELLNANEQNFTDLSRQSLNGSLMAFEELPTYPDDLGPQRILTRRDLDFVKLAPSGNLVYESNLNNFIYYYTAPAWFNHVEEQGSAVWPAERKVSFHASIRVNSYRETLVYDPAAESATLEVKQDAEVLCQDGGTRDMSENFKVQLICKRWKMEPVSVKKYQ